MDPANSRLCGSNGALCAIRKLTIVAITAGVVAACGTTETVNRASQFATAGINYADALPPLYDQSFDASVTAGSIQLEQARRRLDPATRLSELRDQDKLLDERRQLLWSLKQRTILLRSYFIAIKNLAEADEAAGISDAARNTIDRLQALRPSAEELTIGGRPVRDLVGPVVNFAVGAYKSKALRDEFQARASTVERELALQKAIVRLLSEQLASDIAFRIEVDEQRPLAESFASPGNPNAPLPATWRAQRLASFHRTIQVESLEAAVKAADNVHQSWIALVEGVLGGPSVALLIQDVEELVRLAQALRTKS
jgi:hypothetical protein